MNLIEKMRPQIRSTSASALQPGPLQRMQPEHITAVMQIEQDVHAYPWSAGNFHDSLKAHYEAWVLPDLHAQLIGYFLWMAAVDEGHLLNITVRRDLQGQGWGHTLLEQMTQLARESGMQSILLEVRPSNSLALKLYERYGFLHIGRRKAYYPSADQNREDALVMRLPL